MSKPNKKNIKKDCDPYYKAQISETLEDLGKRIHTFRNIGVSLDDEKVNIKSIKLIDELYQVALDEIFDALTNAGDLKAGNLACEGIQKAMLVKRGFIKKSKAFE